MRLQLDGGVEVVEEFLPLKLGGSDVILGIQWLEKLGMVLTNWKTQIMKFELNGEPVTLVGDPALVRAKISLKTMLRVLRKGNGGFWVECNRLGKGAGEGCAVEVQTQVIPEFLAGVISKNA